MVQLILVFLVALTGMAYGQANPLARPESADILLSTPCLLARDELERITTRALENPQRDKGELERVRNGAAQACLGASGTQARPSRAKHPPVAVWLVTPAAPRLAPAIPAPLPSVLSPRLSVITACDPGGCWDSEGVRLQRSGTALIGPAGPCVWQGDLFKCP